MKSVLFIITLFLLFNFSYGQTKYVVRVPTYDGYTLDATYYVPTTTMPRKGYPAIIFVHGFAMSKDETDGSAFVYAQMGYLTFTYSVRGHGNSGGLSTIMSTTERKDLATVVNYVKTLPKADPKMIGISGGSQGGLHGLWAAADKLPVKAITADVIGPRWASDMLANGCFRSTLMYLLYASSVNYDPIRDTLFNLMLADDYDAFFTKFSTSRDINPTAYSLSRTPLMLFGKWQDHYFRANEGINGYATYRAKKDAQKLYLGTGGHYSDDVWIEWNYQFGWITRWFNEFLKGTRTKFLKEPEITYAYSSIPMDTNGYFTWTQRTLSSWPPSGIIPVKFYLSSNNSLTYSPPTITNASKILLNDYRDTTYTFYWAFWDDLQGEWFDSSFRQQTVVFQTPPLKQNLDWVGVPKMHLFVNSDADKFPVNVQIYEVDKSGNKYFVNRINYIGRKNQPGTIRVIDADGNAHAHQFKSGNSVRIEITNLDKTNRKLLGYYPFVVPVFKRSQTAISMDASRPSYIELPTLSGVVPKTIVAPAIEKPKGTIVSQNYPNPFNPSTKIQFVLPEKAIVTIKVFNIIGQEVAVLTEKNIFPAGQSSLLFNASNLSSGVYFYNISAEGLDENRNKYNHVKKILLLY